MILDKQWNIIIKNKKLFSICLQEKTTNQNNPYKITKKWPTKMNKISKM